MDRAFDPKSVTYEELEKQFSPMMKKFAGEFKNYGLDFDDIMQELRIALWKAQDKFDATRGAAKFSTYVYRAFTTTAGKMSEKITMRKKRVHPSLLVSIENQSFEHPAFNESYVDYEGLLAPFNDKQRIIIALRTAGYKDKELLAGGILQNELDSIRRDR